MPHLLTKLLFKRPWRLLVLFSLGIAATFSALVGVFAQKSFVNKLQTGESSNELWLLLLLAAVGLFFAQALQSVCNFLFVREGTVIHRQISEKIYDQTIALRGESRFKFTIGETVSLYAQDVGAVVALFDSVLPIIANAGVPLLCFPFALMWMDDLPPAPLLITALISLSICLYLAQRQARLFGLTKASTAARIAIINEWLQNMRVVRMLGWSDHFNSKILAARENETIARVKQVSNGSAMNGLMQVAPYLLNAVALVYTAFKPEVSAGSLVAALWLCGVFLVRPLRSFPWVLVNTLDALASAQRLEKYLSLEREHDKSVAQSASSEQGVKAEVRTTGTDPNTAIKPTIDAQIPALRVRGLRCTHQGHLILDNLSFDVSTGECIAVIGPVGSGKTTLLYALLREIPCSFDVYEINGRNALTMPLAELRSFFGFVPQDSFIMSATIRDNVGFEYELNTDHDTQKIKQLHLSAFTQDLRSMSEGLDTEIGERGVNLSGGQRQRINLARAAGLERECLLLDDCLSAVDVATENQLIENLIFGAWKEKTRILVTHRLSVLPFCHEIWTLEHGRLVSKQVQELVNKEGTDER